MVADGNTFFFLSPMRIVCILAMVFIGTAHTILGEHKMRVGILDFSAKGVPDTEASIVGDMVRGDIVQADVFDVLNRKNMDVILKEQEFQNTGCTETACAVQIGKILNMEYLIYGSIAKLGDAYFLQTEMVNIETGRITVSARVKFLDIGKPDAAVAHSARCNHWQGWYGQPYLHSRPAVVQYPHHSSRERHYVICIPMYRHFHTS